MKYRILREAEDELESAAFWYDEHQIGVGEAFLTEWQRVSRLIWNAPSNYPPAEDYIGQFEVRRCLLRRFPYTIIYQCFPEEVVIVAVSHGSQRPLYWVDRLSSG